MEVPILTWIDQSGHLRKVQVNDRVFVGRCCKGVETSKQILIKEPHVSRDHAVITRAGSIVTISDMSRNGTYLNGIRMAAGSTMPLKPQDIVRIGETEIQMVLTSAATLHGISHDEAEATFIAPNKIYVTNLVADVRGFTGMTEMLDSQVITHLLRNVFKKFGDIIQSHSGTLSDFAGDAVYAFWEHSLGPDPQKVLLACQAARKQEQILETIRGDIDRYPELKKIKLRLGWGITTGKVTMSHYTERSSDLALVGDATNIAFRLSCMANKDVPASILLCSNTAKLIQHNLPVKLLGSFPIRGRKGCEDVYALL